METKTYSAFTFEVKEADKSTGRFRGVASKYGVEDDYGDVIEKGAFTKTIKERSFPVLWQHRSADVIGEGTIKESGDEIILDAELDMDDPVAVRALNKVQKKLIRGLSVGFQTIKATFEEVKTDGATKYIRHIHELKLWEVSVVTFPALSEAQITSTKHSHDQALAEREDTPPEPSVDAEPPKGDQEPVADHSWVKNMEVPKWKSKS